MKRKRIIPKFIKNYLNHSNNLIFIIKELSSDDLQSEGMESPLSKAKRSTKWILKNNILAWPDSGCSNPKCTCHNKTAKRIYWIEKFKDANGVEFTQMYSSNDIFNISTIIIR